MIERDSRTTDRQWKRQLWRMIAIAILSTIVVIVCFVPVKKSYDDGEAKITVTARSISNRPIKSITAESLVNVESARQRLGDLPLPALTRYEQMRYSAIQEPYVGRPLEVIVPKNEISQGYLLWTHTRHSQFYGLLVVVQFEDKTLLGRALEIPDLWQNLTAESRHLVVEVP